MVLLLIKTLFVFRISRHVNWIILTLERVRNFISLNFLGGVNNSNFPSSFGSLLWRFHFHCIPHIWTLRLHLPHLPILLEVSNFLHPWHPRHRLADPFKLNSSSGLVLLFLLLLGVCFHEHLHGRFHRLIWGYCQRKRRLPWRLCPQIHLGVFGLSSLDYWIVDIWIVPKEA